MLVRQKVSYIGSTSLNSADIITFMNKVFGILLVGWVSVLFAATTVFAETVTLKDLIKRDGLTYKKFSTEPYSGEVASFFKNGQLGDYGNYKNGKKVGIWKRYFINGNLGSKENWNNGERHGLFEMFWPNGELRAIGQYSYGQQSGEWRIYDEAGNLLETQKFF